MAGIKISKKQNRKIFYQAISKKFYIFKIKIIGLEDEVIKKILN